MKIKCTMLLLHQFMAGQHQAVRQQLRVTGEAKDLAATMERAFSWSHWTIRAQWKQFERDQATLSSYRSRLKSWWSKLKPFWCLCCVWLTLVEGRGAGFTATVWNMFSTCVPNTAKAQMVAVASYATGKVTWPESLSREMAKRHLSEAAGAPCLHSEPPPQCSHSGNH